MSNYDKGARGERELIGIFENNGFVCLRAPSSGAGTKREVPDVIAGNGEVFYVLEVKRWGNEEPYQYLTREEVDDLEYFAEGFGAEYYIAARFDRGEWGFFKREELHSTDKSFRIDKFKSDKTVRGINDVCQQYQNAPKISM